MRKLLFVVAIAAAVSACSKKAKPLDKAAACDHIYTAYSSHQDKKAWTDACTAAPDETVRCMNLVMEEGKDHDCMKAIKSPDRTKLVILLNGEPAGSAPAPAPEGSAAPAPEGSAAPAPEGSAAGGSAAPAGSAAP